MGSDVPIDVTEIDPSKFYKITFNLYARTAPNFGCTTLVGPTRCCVLGSAIIEWVNNDWQCTGINLCSPFGITSERLLSFIGPFDTFPLCDVAV